jgi:hypothetical protein
MDLESPIPTEHVVQVVDTAIDKMDLRTLLRQYKGDGTSSHHPGTMLRGPGVHLQPADLLVVAFFQSAAGERGLHVAEWEQPAGLPDGQPVPGQGDEGAERLSFSMKPGGTQLFPEDEGASAAVAAGVTPGMSCRAHVRDRTGAVTALGDALSPQQKR